MALHVLIIAALVSQSGSVQLMLPRILQGVRLLPARPPPPKPPATLAPRLAMPNLAPIPPPDIVVNLPQSPLAPRAVIRVPATQSAPHFAPAGGDAGLGLDLAASSSGGARGRGSLSEFQAAVKRAVLAHKVQPSLAWDRRNTCVINYTVSVAQNGALAGLSIDPCAVPEINAAAQAAIRAAAPFSPPPDLGAARTEVHGTLVFRP